MFACVRPVPRFLCFAAALALFAPSAHAQQQPAQISITVQAYEVGRDDAAALLTAQPEKLDAVSVVQNLSAMSAKQASKILKLGAATGPGGARMKGSDADGSFEAVARQAPGGGHVDLMISATCAGAVTTTAVAIPSKGFAFVGAVDQGASGKVVMIFARSS